MPNTIIRASAGSGKTFQLSNRYLDIVFRSPDAPVETVANILASTFTRKAAGEILERILRRLAEAAADPKQQKELAEFIELPASIQEIQKILAELARNLYRFRVSTLDSFFNKIASAFALELGLPPGWMILEDTDYARCLNEAVRNVVNQSAPSDILSLMNMLQQGEQDRNVTRDMIDLASDLLLIFRESKPEHWIHNRLLKTELSNKELQKVLDRFQTAEIPKNKDGTEPKRFTDAKEKLIRLVQTDAWKLFLEHTLVKNAVAGDFKFDRKELDGELLYCVQKLIDQGQAVQVNKLVGQTKATYDILKRIDAAYNELLLREHGFRFDDITDRLVHYGSSLEKDLLAHRIDARTAYLLLDEFQDTSLSQWNVMEPFAKEAAAAQNGSVFVVGDVKQAIYGWKGGVAEIFDTIRTTITEAEDQPLNVSWRNSLSVIGTVNKIFDNIKSNPALQKDDVYQSAAEVWNERFETHQTMKKDKGYCVLKVAQNIPDINEEDDADRDDLDNGDGEADANKPKEKWFTQYKVNLIAELHWDKPSASIGILVRNNDKVGRLIAGLKKLGIEASEEGGNPLTDSPAVQHILSAMTLADHPGDRIARFHLAKGPLAEVLNLTDYDNDLQARLCSFELRKALVNEGYGAVIEKLSLALAPACNPRDFQRLEKLMELALRFQETATGVRADCFVKMVQATKKESPTSSPIRMMTIHKSKGLEFDIVVLPDLDVSLVSQRPPRVIVARKTPAAPIDFVIRYAGKDLQPFLPEEYQRAFKMKTQSEVEESLSLLYVALTRAKQEMVMIVPPLTDSALKKSSYSSTFAGILRAGLCQTEIQNNDTEILFQDGDKNWYEKMDKKSETKLQSPCEITLQKKLSIEPTKKMYRNLPRNSASSLELKIAAEPGTLEPDHSGIDSNLPDANVSGLMKEKRTRDDALLWGTAMHACFEHGLRKNPWLDEGKPDMESLRQIVEIAVLGKKGNINSQEVVAEFLKSCGKPNIHKILSRSNYNAETIDVEHERRFAVRLDNELLHGSIDRLVILRKSNMVVGLEIIDYKTDRLDTGRDEAEFLAERQKVYEPQLEAYRNGMSRLYGLDPSNIKTTLIFTDFDRVISEP